MKMMGAAQHSGDDHIAGSEKTLTLRETKVAKNTICSQTGDDAIIMLGALFDENLFMAKYLDQRGCAAALTAGLDNKKAVDHSRQMINGLRDQLLDSFI